MKRLILALVISAAFGCADDATDPRTPLVSNNAVQNNAVQNSAMNAMPNGTSPNADANSTTPNASNSDPNVFRSPATWVIGTSVAGRPIVAEHYGESGPVLFLLSAIHGDERLAVTFGERVRARLLSGMAQRAGIQIYFVGAANPDGIVANSRENARGIDLNRNFPADNFDPNAGGGDEPLSEPESMALYESTFWVDPAAVVSVHCCAPTLDWDGPAEPLAETMSQAMDPSIAFGTVRLGSRPGSFGSFIGIELGRPIVTVEFALGNGDDPALQLSSMVEAIEAAAVWTGENGANPEVTPLDEIIGESSNVFESFEIGSSAGGLPLRVDRVGFDGSANYLVSGLDGAERRGEWIAEHLRADKMLELRHNAGEGVHFLTQANPDGWTQASSRNADGDDVLAQLGNDGDAAESRAVWDWLETVEPGVVFVVEDGDEDRITTHGDRASDARRAIPFELLGDDADLAANLQPFVSLLVERGHTVVVIEVASEYFEAQGISTDNPDFKPSPTIYSDAVDSVVAALR